MVVLNLVKSFRNSTGFTVCLTAAGPKWAGSLGRRQSSYTFIGSSVPLLFMSMLLPETFFDRWVAESSLLLLLSLLNITLIFIGTIERVRLHFID